jgi:hypothetical protein
MIGRSGFGRGTVLVPRPANARVHEIVQGALPVSKATPSIVLIEVTVATPPMLRIATGRGQASVAAKRLMVYRHHWRTLPSGRHVGSPEIVRHGAPEPPCQPGSIPNPDRQP